MSEFRRTIAVFMLVLFTCQSVLAGIDEHVDWFSGEAGEAGQSVALADHPAQDESDHDHTGAAAGAVDADCCHAHGHCHLLAFVAQVSDISIPLSPDRTAPRTCSYHSLYTDTLLRPPASA